MLHHCITREDLHLLIWSWPLSKLARQFGLSDVVLKNACDRHEIPRPPQGHWTRVDLCKRPATVPLPGATGPDPEFWIDLSSREYASRPGDARKRPGVRGKREADGRHCPHFGEQHLHVVAQWTGQHRITITLGAEGRVEVRGMLCEGGVQTQDAVRESTIGAVLEGWEASDRFKRRATSTKLKERSALKSLRAAPFTSLQLAVSQDIEIRRQIRAWLGTVATSHPRAADTRKDILSKAFNWAIEEGLSAINPVKGIADFSFCDRSDIIWLPSDIERFSVAARERRRKFLGDRALEPEEAPAVVSALLLACYTGVRREDLVNLRWTDIGPSALTIRPRKSVRRRKTSGRKKPPFVIIPRTPELNQVLATLEANRARGPWLLTNHWGHKWTPEGLTSSFIRIRDAARIEHPAQEPGDKPTPKTLHDARGTFVTHMRCRGYGKDEVASMVGWQAEDVDRIAMRYADAERIATAWLARLNAQAGEPDLLS